MELIPADGNLVACSDYPAVVEVVRNARAPVVSYGATGDWQAAKIRFENGRSFFTPLYRGKPEGEVEAGVIGRHNVHNALAVYAMGRALGIPLDKLLGGFATFQGVKRRQEIKGERRGIVVIDDFAHHPTAVMETIDAVRAAYPQRRLWALFEPRSNTSRRNIFAKEFAHSLARADLVIVSDLYQPDKVPSADRLSVGGVVAEINRLTNDERAVMIADSQAIADHVATRGAPGDVVLVMSNGGFDGVQDKILRALEIPQ
jgi:UDP-N-acetylmuramate: L-alanyl-gamma-D-glutamyl-meso-diaminopimelate ligase